MSDDGDEQYWFISYIKVEVGAREQWGTKGRETSQEVVVVI